MALNPEKLYEHMPLYREVHKNNILNYNDYRCPQPMATKTGAPWYPRDDTCPCNPDLANITGRGYVSCPIGIDETVGKSGPAANLSNIGSPPSKDQVRGSLFNQMQVVPPQFYPYPHARVGQAWRTVN